MSKRETPYWRRPPGKTIVSTLATSVFLSALLAANFRTGFLLIGIFWAFQVGLTGFVEGGEASAE